MAFNKNKETRLVEKKLQPLKVYIKFLFLLEKSERVQVKALVCKSVRPAPSFACKVSRLGALHNTLECACSSYSKAKHETLR